MEQSRFLSLVANGDAPEVAINKLYPKPNWLKRSCLRWIIRNHLKQRTPHHPKEEELEKAYRSVRFPYRPSELFLKIFWDVIYPLERNPTSGIVSPHLIGTSGVVPMSVLSHLDDIIIDQCNAIVNAQREILFATCYWQKGANVDRISNAFVELSKRVAQRKQKEKVVIKLLMDRAWKKNIFVEHKRIPPSKWHPWLDLPTEEEIPNLSMEIMNYHRPLLGTFHAKFLIVDRSVALISSNNIQDRPNMELCVHLEGDVVNSLYETFLISWGQGFHPNIPCLNLPASSVYNFSFRESNTTPEALQSDPQGYMPFVYHQVHSPVPIALVNRPAHGAPGHKDIRNPQDAAWLSAFRCASQSILIQMPTFNTRLAVQGVVDACRRGVKVTLLLSWGFNDGKESLPFQGGTNVKVVKFMQKWLKKKGCVDNLKVYWYTSKFRTEPVKFSKRKANCHVKFMAVDDQIAIFGNGNMDSHSWYHSEEVNIMVDSRQIVNEWMIAFQRNQNTWIFGEKIPVFGKPVESTIYPER